jgi:hypothetical protein
MKIQVMGIMALGERLRLPVNSCKEAKCEVARNISWIMRPGHAVAKDVDTYS